MKPTIVQGTRDFDAYTIYRREYILNNIRTIFENHGFEPLETPALENIETLMGKYGDEGDKLIFKILNNGLDNENKREQAKEHFEQILQGKNVKDITSRALKYDLTIPFARYVVMHQGQLTLPYKRFQMQPVWRADRPQKGRYREFTQCDADIVGSTSMMNEIELSRIYAAVFKTLNIPVSICINHRKILSALAEKCGSPDLLTPIAVAIDKLDKIGLQNVLGELEKRGLDSLQRKIITQYLEIGFTEESNEKKLSDLKQLLGTSVSFAQASENLTEVFDTCPFITFDPTLARGLDYYTGCIFEVKAKDVEMGSIGGGGRYDNLTTSFGGQPIPGVGISFGIDRIYDVMEALNQFPNNLVQKLQLLILNFDKPSEKDYIRLADTFRKKGIPTMIYPDSAKMSKQMKYADKKNIPYVLLYGEDEKQKGMVTLKNMQNGDQNQFNPEDAVLFLKNNSR